MRSFEITRDFASLLSTFGSLCPSLIDSAFQAQHELKVSIGSTEIMLQSSQEQALLRTMLYTVEVVSGRSVQHKQLRLKIEAGDKTYAYIHIDMIRGRLAY